MNLRQQRVTELVSPGSTVCWKLRVWKATDHMVLELVFSAQGRLNFAILNEAQWRSFPHGDVTEDLGFTNAISFKADLPTAGPWYVIASNTEREPLGLTGTITYGPV